MYEWDNSNRCVNNKHFGEFIIKFSNNKQRNMLLMGTGKTLNYSNNSMKSTVLRNNFYVIAILLFNNTNVKLGNHTTLIHG